jgi:hypothetical protein
VDGAAALTYAIFGGPPVQDADLTTKARDKDAAKCQLEMLKQAGKLENTILKEVNKAKKTALKAVATSSSSVLAAELEDAFSSDKIVKTEEKLVKGVDKRCAALQDPATTFPGACAHPDLAVIEECVIAAARCQACLATNAMDDLTLDCDQVDDRTLNASCP